MDQNKTSNNNNQSNSLVKKRLSRNTSTNPLEAPNVMNNNEREKDDLNYHSNNIQTSNHIKPQLVPIQRFSFFKWQINVDTLVRLFIIA